MVEFGSSLLTKVVLSSPDMTTVTKVHLFLGIVAKNA
jgi:hypothetical protein